MIIFHELTHLVGSEDSYDFDVPWFLDAGKIERLHFFKLSSLPLYKRRKSKALRCSERDYKTLQLTWKNYYKRKSMDEIWD